MRYFGTGRKLIFGSAAVVFFLLGPAAMADGPRPYVVGVTDVEARTDWTGFYIGGKLGGAWSDISWTQDVNVFSNAGAVPAGAEADFGPSGVAGGVIGGGNLQVGHWIFGLELAYSGVNLSETTTSPFFPATDTFSTQIDWIGTIEGRIGYSWDHYLVFGKGGWAGSNAQLTLVAGSRAATTGATSTTDEFVDGYTLGGGIEVMTWPSVVLGVEYDYVDLSLGGAASCPLCPAGIVAGAPAAVAGSATLSSVMVRASYLFMPED